MPIDGLTAYGRQRGGTNDNQIVQFRATREADQSVTQVLPPLYEMVRQGRVFFGNIGAAGVVPPLWSNTTQQIGLWNPAGNIVDVILLSIDLTYVSTTAAATGFVLSQLTNAPAAIGTGLAITAYTETAAIPAMNGGQFASVAKFGQGATLTVTAPTMKRHLGLSQLVTTATTATATTFSFRRDFYGDEVLAPGTAVFVGGNIAPLITVSGSLTWAEWPRS